jgi:hypothetical protein
MVLFVLDLERSVRTEEAIEADPPITARRGIIPFGRPDLAERARRAVVRPGGSRQPPFYVGRPADGQRQRWCGAADPQEAGAPVRQHATLPGLGPRVQGNHHRSHETGVMAVLLTEQKFQIFILASDRMLLYHVYVRARKFD